MSLNANSGGLYTYLIISPPTLTERNVKYKSPSIKVLLYFHQLNSLDISLYINKPILSIILSLFLTQCGTSTLLLFLVLQQLAATQLPFTMKTEHVFFSAFFWPEGIEDGMEKKERKRNSKLVCKPDRVI